MGNKKQNIQYKTGSDDFDSRLFQTFPTNTAVDKIWTDSGGLMRGMTVIAIGDPGVGKTTILTDLAAKLQTESNCTAVFISGEEGQLDRAYAEQQHNNIIDLPILFPRSYSNPADAMFQAFEDNWDFVFADSFKVLQEMIAASENISSRQAEQMLLQKLVSLSTTGPHYTTFVCIQQVTTDGAMRGSNDIKHDTTATLEFRFDGKDKRYMTFSKNRRAGSMVGKRVYYDLIDQEIVYSNPVSHQSNRRSKSKKSLLTDSSLFSEYIPNAASKFRSRLGKKKRH